MNTPVEAMLAEALAYQARGFELDEPINGADLVEWFSQWRARAQAAINSSRERTGAAQRRTVPVCSECGSGNVCADAAARWDAGSQEWEVVNVFDKGHSCDDCQHCDARLEWKEEERRAGFLE